MGVTTSAAGIGVPAGTTPRAQSRGSRFRAREGGSARPAPAHAAVAPDATEVRYDGRRWSLCDGLRPGDPGADVLLYAHRGSSGTIPENTLAAFRRAVADGADGVEFDVRATADGVPVVLHDRDLSRTTTARGRVDGLPLAEVRRCDAGDGGPVPTLAEVLDLLAGRLRLDLEIKQAGIERTVLRLLAARPRANWAISSFDWGVLRTVRALAPDAELWPLATAAGDDLEAVAREVGAGGVALAAGAVDAAVADRYAAVGLPVIAWTVNDPAEARRLRDLGVAAVCTDVPVAIRRALAPTGEEPWTRPVGGLAGGATRSMVDRRGNGAPEVARATAEGRATGRPRGASPALAARR